jgi:hypothetical protein
MTKFFQLKNVDQFELEVEVGHDLHLVYLAEVIFVYRKLPEIKDIIKNNILESLMMKLKQEQLKAYKRKMNLNSWNRQNHFQ